MRGVELNRSSVTFHLPMPKSWSKKKQLAMCGEPHCNRPDLDNLCKSLMDALLPEDSHVHEIRLRKLWAVRGGIEVWQNDVSADWDYDDLPF